MRQEKYTEIARNRNLYIKEKNNIEHKKALLINCINEINNLKDWSMGSIEESFNKLKYYKIAKDIANSHKHHKLKKDGKTLSDFINIVQTNGLILEKDKDKEKYKYIENDLILKNNKDIKEYEYIEIKLNDKEVINAYEFLNQCLEEIHGLINRTKTN